jgi:OFA family oxalate/formate antiporter-like MFS transporter
VFSLRLIHFDRSGETKQKKKQPTIYYGWYILTIGMIGAFMATGFSQLFMSVMLKPLTAEFGWSRTAATGAITAGTILSGLLSLPFGKLADRYGPRVLTSLGALVTAVLYYSITKFVDLWGFYAVYIIGRIVSTNAISNIVPRTATVNWFRRLRGRALGLLSMASPLGSSVLAIIAQFIMKHHDWRTVFILFAVGTICLQALPAALILRRRPEDHGLLPDGDQETQADASSTEEKNSKEERSWTLSEAIQTPTLWLLIVASIIALIVNAGVGFHLVAYYTDVGIAASVAVGALSIYAFTGAVANVVWGFLSERMSERLLASAVMILTAATVLYLQAVTTPSGAFIFAVFFGLTSRGEGTLVNIILAQYYGRNSYGAISGFVNPFYMIGLGAGPLISSLMFDHTGSYQSIFTIFIALSLVSAMLLWLAKKPILSVKISSRQSCSCRQLK